MKSNASALLRRPQGLQRALLVATTSGRRTRGPCSPTRYNDVLEGARRHHRADQSAVDSRPGHHRRLRDLHPERRATAASRRPRTSSPTSSRRRRQRPELAGVTSTFNATSQQLLADVDRDKAEMLGVPVEDVYATMQTMFGSLYVSQFNQVQPAVAGDPAGGAVVPADARGSRAGLRAQQRTAAWCRSRPWSPRST